MRHRLPWWLLVVTYDEPVITLQLWRPSLPMWRSRLPGNAASTINRALLGSSCTALALIGLRAQRDDQVEAVNTRLNQFPQRHSPLHNHRIPKGLIKPGRLKHVLATVISVASLAAAVASAWFAYAGNAH